MVVDGVRYRGLREGWRLHGTRIGGRDDPDFVFLFLSLGALTFFCPSYGFSYVERLQADSGREASLAGEAVFACHDQ